MVKDADSDPLSAGPMLREAREKSGLSVFEVAEKLHLTEHYVHALESEDYEKLPSEVYVNGYIKSYALLLDLDEEQVMGAYRQPGAPAAGEISPLRAAPVSFGRKWTLPLLLVLLAGALAAAAWWAFQAFGAAAGFLAAGAAKHETGKF
ncbi:MAG: helix-turn-helix transcriptional regulator [Gammaproteobacteria bacterium]|nr:helix-turn-helix transcriptional regulator [Gammaproteobacteria bacterium]